jgi:hypothetical protein|nr:MAG TPA: hypothetical protein [Caudoviricetes sp.]
MNKKEKKSLIEILKEIRGIVDMSNHELRQRYRWLEEYDEIGYEIRCGIVQAEIDYLIGEYERGVR